MASHHRGETQLAEPPEKKQRRNPFICFRVEEDEEEDEPAQIGSYYDDHKMRAR